MFWLSALFDADCRGDRLFLAVGFSAMKSLLLTLFAPLDSSFTSVSFLFFLVKLTVNFVIFAGVVFSITRHCRFVVYDGNHESTCFV